MLLKAHEIGENRSAIALQLGEIATWSRAVLNKVALIPNLVSLGIPTKAPTEAVPPNLYAIGFDAGPTFAR
jgi:hypothetical protein